MASTQTKAVALNKTLTKKYSLAAPAAADVQQRTQNYATTYVPVSTTEHIRRSRVRRERAADIRSRIADIRKHAHIECGLLSQKYKRKTRYFLDMVYQGGVRLTKPANETNNFNAFKSVTAYERREAGLPPMTIVQIQKEFRPKYDAMTEEEITNMLIKYRNIRDEEKREKIKHASVKEKAADVAGSLNNVAGILQGLKTRVGVDAVLLVVKNRPDDFMGPRWIVTDERLMEYLHVTVRDWNPVTIGQRLEAFAVAGCNPALVCKNQKDHAELLKKMIARHVQDGLDSACKTKNLAMQYERFDHLITAKYGVIIEGWPANLTFQKPGNFHGDTNKLLQLNEAWKSGIAHFRKLTSEEWAEWKSARAQGLANGTIKPKQRKKRNDAGTKRSKKGEKKGGKPKPKPKGKGKVTLDVDEGVESDVDEEEETDEEDRTDEEGESGDEDSEVPALEPSATSSKKPKSKKGQTGKQTSGKKKKAAAQTTTKKAHKNKNARDKCTTPESMDHTDEVTISTPGASNAQGTDNPPSPPAQPRPLPRRKLPLNSNAQTGEGNARTTTVDDGERDGGSFVDQHDVGPTLGDKPLPATSLTPVPSINPHGFVGPALSIDISTITDATPPPNPSTPFPDAAIDPALKELGTTTEPHAEQHGQALFPSPTLTLLSPADGSAPVSAPDGVPSTVPEGDPKPKLKKRKRQEEELAQPSAVGVADGGSKRTRKPRVIRHLGASSHPATRAREQASDDEGPSG
ncbi:hypothetical protein PM082_006101 [Marasmius tenuissimus]|nr:hypothetical protein PM082_006101 [Marasmius tenuissimus]